MTDEDREIHNLASDVLALVETRTSGDAYLAASACATAAMALLVISGVDEDGRRLFLAAIETDLRDKVDAAKVFGLKRES